MKKIAASLTKFVLILDRSENKIAALVSDKLWHFQILLCKRWTEVINTWQEASTQRPLPGLYFSGWLEKQHYRPGIWLVDTFAAFLLQPTKLDWRDVLNILYRDCVFRTNRYQHMFHSKQSYSGPRLWPCGPLVCVEKGVGYGVKKKTN